VFTFLAVYEGKPSHLIVDEDKVMTGIHCAREIKMSKDCPQDGYGSAICSLPRACLGFGLFELIIVLAIIACLGGIAVPHFSNSISNRRAEMAARRLAADLTMAQQTAKASSGTVTVSFLSASGSYAISSVKGLDHTKQPYQVYLRDEPYYAEIVDTSLDGNTTIVFDGYGRVSTGGSVSVRSGRFQHRIVIAPFTGKVSIQ